MPIKFCPDHPATIFTAEVRRDKCSDCGKELLWDGKFPRVAFQAPCTSKDGSEVVIARCESENDCMFIQTRGPGPVGSTVVLSETHVSAVALAAAFSNRDRGEE